MAHNDFENNIQSRFQSFESTPPESVWTHISNFRDRRKKRLLFFWWLLPISLFAGTSIVFFSLPKHSSIELNSNTYKHNNQIHTSNYKKKSENNKAIIEPPVETATTISLNTRSITQSINVELASEPSNSPTQKEMVKNYSVEEIVLDPMLFLALHPKQEALNLASTPSYLPTLKPVWRRNIGLEIGSFVTVSRIEDNSPPPISLSEPSNVSQLNSYRRFAELSSYIEWQNRTTGMGFRTNVLYSIANFSKVIANESARGKQHSVALGFETNYQFIQKRFGLSAFLKFQGEFISSRYSNGGPYDWNGGSMPVVTISAESTANYQQWVLSGEAGLRCHYVLPKPYWHLHGTMGYRNYFWQQAFTENQYVLEIPQLLHIGISISRDF